VYRFDGTTHISAIDAERMLSIVGNGDLAPIPRQARRLAGRAAAAIDRSDRVRSPRMGERQGARTRHDRRR
jgi:hypothetical protein